MPTTEHTNSAQASSSSLLCRIRRGLLWVFIFATCSLVTLAVGVTFWLASEGIQLGSVSGISLSQQGMSVKNLSIKIRDNEFELNNVLLFHRYTAEQHPIIQPRHQDSRATGWLVQADRLTVVIPSALRRALLENGLIADIVTFDKVKLMTQGALTDGRFMITADLADALLATPLSKTTYQQSLHGISISVSTAPNLQISGAVGRGDIQPPLAAFIKDGYHRDNLRKDDYRKDNHHKNGYPVTFKTLSFALMPAEDGTQPFSVSIAHIASATAASEQSERDGVHQLSLAVDLLSPQSSLDLRIKTLRWDPAPFLPQDQASASTGFPRLGQITSLLFQVPVKHIEIDSITIIDYLSQARFIFQRDAENTRFELEGKVQTAKNTLLPVTSYFLASEHKPAVFTVQLTDTDHTSPSGIDLVSCHASWQLTSDMPQSLNCKSDNVTKVLNYFSIQSISLPDPNQQQAVFEAKLTETDQPQKKQLKKRQPEKKDHQPDSASEPDSLSPVWHYAIEISAPGSIQFRLPRSHQHSGPNDYSVIALNHDGIWKWALSLDQQQAQLRLTNPEQLDINVERPAAQGQIVINTLTCHVTLTIPAQQTETALPQCRSTNTLTAQAPLLELESLKISHLQLSQRIDIQSSGSSLKLNLENTRLSAQTIVLPDYADQKQNRLSQVRIEIPDTAIQLDNLLSSASAPENTSQVWLLDVGEAPATLSAAFSSLRTINADTEPGKHQGSLPVQQFEGNLAIMSGGLRAEKNAQAWKLASNYSTQLALSVNNQALPVIRNQGKLTLNSDALAITGLLSTAQSQPWLDFSFTQEWKSRISRVQIVQKPISFSAKQSLQKYYLAPLPVSADLHNGSISLRADLQYQNALWSGTLDIFTTHLSGHIKDTHFADLNVSLTSLVTDNTIRSRQPMTVHAGWLHFGTLFQDVTASFHFDTDEPLYTLHRATANVLGGQLSTRNVVSRSLTNIDVIPLRIQSLNLKKLMDLFNPENVELTGSLDGLLPIRIVSGNPVIEKGALFSRSPGGVLRYKEGTSIDDNVRAGGENSLKVITRILRNYQYDSLAVDIDYSKEGQLNASARFKGRNPHFQNGRPVNINLNIEDDIPALIKTLNTINTSQFERIFVKQLGLEN
ncbi:intermembrane phospholipid transport protein YdbH family protein [Photobacterium halotolerans]|uniref:intermembrane phospholipid transport protein YdbH family protein n=1 Tax=Photobacterium halotolerans TaxID=265726 RepID=UPI0004820346|nr:YdbH domain-containing protein [Photobacterium halotolerans]